MNPDLHNRASAIFIDARTKKADELDDFLDQACNGDQALRDAVLNLLENDSADTHFLETPAIATDAAHAALGAGNPERVGAFRINRILGEGGMGIVYEAEQEHPKRTVALKMLKAGLSTRAAQRRFEREAELLGRLRHPGVAQVFEAGTANVQGSHRPYFAMELVRGESITSFAEANKLDLRQRLSLLAEVCDAVQHAHQRGVIHRDLKPANVLVESDDESGTHHDRNPWQPKVLDFGVARATDADATMRTDAGQLVGTLRYMSPEQVSGDPLAVDARSDVYALGLIGYELLTGNLPYTIEGHGVAEVARIIQETEPTTLGTHTRLYRGDVETILAKALEKDPERRYQSAAELGADLRRFLHDEAIVARPASALYQMSKFARRHRAIVVGAACVFLAVLLGAVISTSALIMTSRAKSEAELQAERAQSVLSFLQDMLVSPDPSADGADVRVVDVLDKAAPDIDNLFPDPEVAGFVHHTVGYTYKTLSQFDRATEHFKKAHAHRSKALGEASFDAIASATEIADVMVKLGQTVEAEQMARDLIALHREHNTIENARSVEMHNVLFLALRDLGELEDAEQVIREGIRLCDLYRGDCFILRANLASLLHDQGRLPEAEQVYRVVVPLILESRGEEHDLSLSISSNFARLLLTRGKFEEGAEVLTRVLEVRRRSFGKDNYGTFTAMTNLGDALQRLGRFDEAIALYEEAIPGFEAFGLRGESTALTTRNNLATVYMRQEMFAEAEPVLRAILDVHESGVGNNTDRIITMANLGNTLRRLDRLDEAHDILVESHDLAVASLPPGHFLRYIAESNLGQIMLSLGRLDEAEPPLLSGTNGLIEVLTTNHPITQKSIERTIDLYETWDRPDDAETFRQMLPPPEPVEADNGADTAAESDAGDDQEPGG